MEFKAVGLSTLTVIFDVVLYQAQEVLNVRNRSNILAKITCYVYGVTAGRREMGTWWNSVTKSHLEKVLLQQKIHFQIYFPSGGLSQ